jgi:hypothetical protein
MSNFKSAAKRKRELAKLDKRQARDQKRALRRAERSGPSVGAAPATTTATTQSVGASARPVPRTAPVSKVLTLTEAVERWKRMKVGTPKKR